MKMNDSLKDEKKQGEWIDFPSFCYVQTPG